MGRFNFVKIFGVNNKFDKYILKKEGEKIIFISFFLCDFALYRAVYFTILHAH